MKLVDDWRNGWKWMSVHFSIAGIGFNFILSALVKSITIVIPLIGHVPLRWVFLLGAAIALACLISRFIVQRYGLDDNDIAGD